jgi:outer membrane protein assembly factor BamB
MKELPFMRAMQRMMIPLALGLAVAAGVCLPNVPALQAQVVRPSGAETGGLDIFVPPDRETRQRLAMARNLIAEQRYGDAVRFLARILENDEDYLLTDSDTATSPSVWTEVMRLLGTLPPKGLQEYELRFGGDARQLLESALASGSVERLEQTYRRYFHTAAGYQAAYLLGMHYLDQGQAQLAESFLGRLAATPAAADFEPLLSVALAIAQQRAGLPDRAEATLSRLAQQHPRARIQVAGRDLPLSIDVDSGLAWLQRLAGAPPQMVQRHAEQWPLPGGNPQRNAVVRADVPVSDVIWAVPMADRPDWFQQIVALHEQFRDQNPPLMALPAAQPLVVNDWVIVRTIDKLLAIDFRTGKRVWQVQTTTVDPVLESAGEAPLPYSDEWPADELERRLADDLTYGMLSSDGRCVYLVQDLLPHIGVASPMSFLPAADASDPYARGNVNRLEAYALARAEGNLRWQVGGPRGDNELPLAGTFFLGPPLPLGDTLYVLGERAGEIRLMALDSRNGRPLWEQQLARLDRFVGTDPVRRLAGVTPSYADGVLVCPTSAGAVVAVDLTTRALRWGFRYGRDISGLPSRRAQAPGGVRTFDRWMDTTALLADGRVFLAPVESNKLYCIDLRDGRLLWSRDRSGGSFLPGVHNGQLLVVAQSAVHWFDAQTGAETRVVPLPSGAAPSGRGLLTADHYLLPLTSTELVRIDLDSGALTRHRSRQGRVLGNLVAYRGCLVSQGLEFVECLYQRPHLEQLVADRLQRHPDDAEALTLHAQLLLDSGQQREAVDQLRRSFRLQRDPHTRALLVETLLHGLKTDFAAHRQSVSEVQALLERQEERAEFLRSLAQGLEKSGDPRAAFEVYYQLLELPADGTLERVDPQWKVRRERWLQARLAALYQRADDAARQGMHALVDQELQRAVAGDDPQALRRFLAVFPHFPQAAVAQARLAEHLRESGRPLERELILARLADSADDAQAAAAVAELAQMYARAERPMLAAHYYDRLGSRYGDVRLPDGRTGSQWRESLTDAAAAHRWLRDQSSAWPRGPVAASTRPRSPTSYRVTPIDSSDSPLPPVVDTTVHWDASRQAVIGRDPWGRQRWSLSVAEAGRLNYYVNPSVMRATFHGSLVLVSLGYEVYALDTLGGSGSARLLWKQDLAEDNGTTVRNYGVRTRMNRMAWGAQRYFATDQFNRPLGVMGPVTDHYVCLQRARDLVALDPLSGEILWQRRGLPHAAVLFGDDELVFAAGENDNTAVVLRAADGHMLGQRRIPPADRIVAPLGRKLLLWDASGGRTTVRLWDAWTQTDLWTRSFDDSARGYTLGRDALAVMQRDGHFTLLELHSGKSLIDAQLPAEPDLTELYVLASREHYLVLTNTPPRNDANVGYVNPIPGGVNNPRMQGHVHAFARSDGAHLWSREVKHQAIQLEQPGELPVLLFACQIYRRDPATNRGATYFSVLCLDKRDGRILFEHETTTGSAHCDALGNPSDRTVTLEMTQQTVTLTFGAPQPSGSEEPPPLEAPSFR